MGEDFEFSNTPGESLLLKGVNNEETQAVAIRALGDCYIGIQQIIDRYLDINESDKKVVALWIIGTYLHKEFNTYPFLFINAMKGSGKTRFLRLIEALAKNGKLTNSMTEAVLFRTASSNTILIDEFESVGNKEKSALRELLNSAYKRGTRVERMKKKFTKEGDQMVVETFDMYTPVAIANIFGMESVLGDRCIQLILEKSRNPHKIKLMDNFMLDLNVSLVKRTLERVSVVQCSVVSQKKYVEKWNYYIDSIYNYIYTFNTLTTLRALTTLPTLKDAELLNVDNVVLTPEELSLFDIIHRSELDGRHLELFFPLFLIASFIGNETLKEIIAIARERTDVRNKDDLLESDDVAFIDFISRQEVQPFEYVNVTKLTNDFRTYLGMESTDMEHITSKWVGRALKRLGLDLNKKRMASGMYVMLNVPKAKEKREGYEKREK